MKKLKRAIFVFLHWATRREKLTDEKIAELLKKGLDSNRKNISQQILKIKLRTASNYLALGEYQRAIGSFGKLKAYDPSNPNIYLGLATAHLALENNIQAFFNASIGAMLTKGRIDFIFIAAKASKNIGNHEHARNGFLFCLQHPPENEDFSNIARLAKDELDSLS